MGKPFFRDNAFTDQVPRRGAASSKAGLDNYRRLDAVERGFAGHISNDTDELNLYRALGSTLLTYTFDPGLMANTTDHSGVLSDGLLYLAAMYLPKRATATGLAYYVETAGVGTWTTAKVAILSKSGTRLAVSTNDTALCKATGLIQKGFSSTVDLEKGLYYAAIMIDWSAVTTSPKLGSRNTFASSLTNLLCASTNPRACTFSGQTDISSSYTLSSGTLSSAQRWFGLY